MIIANPECVAATAFRFDRLMRCSQHLFRKLTLVERFVAKIGTELRNILREAGVGNDRSEIQSRLPLRVARLQLDQVDAADQLIERPYAECRHVLPDLLGHEAEEVDDHVRQAGEIFTAENVVLRRHTRRAVVEVTDPEVLAAERNHRPGAEAETFGAENRGFNNVEAGLQPTVGLQAHLMAHVIGAQNLVCLGQAELPRASSILHRAQGAGTRAAVVARDRDQVRIGLDDTSGDRAHAGFRNQFDRDERFRVDLFEIEN